MARFDDMLDRGDHGELLMSAIMRSHGFSFTKLGAIERRGAPMIRSWAHATIAPDGLMVRRAPLLAEFKVKSVADVSRGGSPGSNWMRSGQRFHGIDRENFLAYREASKRFNMPLVVLLICITDAVLVGASLEELGEPFASLLPQVHDMVNFPISRWTVLTEFHPKRLKQFFAEPLQRLTESRMVQFVPWLTAVPQQRGFDFVDFLAFENADNRWVRRTIRQHR